MIIRSLTNGRFSGTNTLTCASRIVGAIAITADGTNAAVVTIQRDTSSGKKVFEYSTTFSNFIAGPIATEGTDTIYVSVSGTGATAQLYEWVE